VVEIKLKLQEVLHASAIIMNTADKFCENLNTTSVFSTLSLLQHAASQISLANDDNRGKAEILFDNTRQTSGCAAYFTKG